MYKKRNIIKIIGASIILILLFSTVSGISPSTTSNEELISPTTDEPDTADPEAYTHTVLAESGTASWCGYCKTAHKALKKIYKAHTHQFYYISMIDDKNTHAETRNNEYNLAGFPTVYFDGGYRVRVGAYPDWQQQMSWYESTIVSCGNRAVPDLDINLSVGWLGNATLDINVEVINNEPTIYTGRIRVYVTEPVSSMGWYDSGGKIYTFAFLDYAFNKDIAVGPGDTWQDSTNWDGNNYNDGHGHDFGGITEDNIMVIAAVFNPTWHQGYSDPPSGNPFDAYYVDETAGKWINLPPYTPSDPSPGNGTPDVDGEDVNLTWLGGDPNIDAGDIIGYNVYFGNTSPPPQVSDNQSDTYYYLGAMEYNETYYWQIVAWDSQGYSSSSPIWSFTTKANEPPNVPTDPNPINDSTGIDLDIDLTWTGGDPYGGLPVTYDVYFGNTSPPPQVSVNQSETTYDPGDLNFNTTYYWQIVAEDGLGASTPGPIWTFTTRSVICGDPNDDGIVDLGDIVYLINYLFKQPWPEPQPILCVGDINNDDIVDLGDVVYLLNYLFKQPWPEPNPNCCD